MSTTVSRDLGAILDMADRLRDRAEDLADHGLLGGEATVNLAHVASMRTWAERDEAAGGDLAPFEDPDELWSPLQTLCFWSEQWRAELGMDYDDPRWRPSLASEAGFLRNPDVLAWAWDNEPHFDEFAADVKSARAKLENVLVEGERAERSRIVCPDCDADRALIRVYEARKPTEWACVECATHVDASEADHCPNPFCWSVVSPVPAEWASDPDNDRWKCPACRHKFAPDELGDAYAKQVRSEGGARFVDLRDAIATLVDQGWQERTIRGWLEPLRHTADKCLRCRVKRDPDPTLTACEQKLRFPDGREEVCGGELVPVWRGSRESIIELRCDRRTHRVEVWWPDLWRRHLTARQQRVINQRKAQERAARKAFCEAMHDVDCWEPGRGCREHVREMTAV